MEVPVSADFYCVECDVAGDDPDHHFDTEVEAYAFWRAHVKPYRWRRSKRARWQVSYRHADAPEILAQSPEERAAAEALASPAWRGEVEVEP